MRWLHISDLHFGYENNEIDTMRRELLNQLAPRIKPIDCIFITGDFRYAPKHKIDFPTEVLTYIRDLQNALGVSPKDTFVVQGNHDLNRGDDDSYPKMIETARRSYQTSNGKFGEVVLRNVEEMRKPYKKLYEAIRGQPEPERWHYCEERNGYNIICLNTAIFSCMDKEDGELILGSNLIDDMFNRDVNPNLPSIVLAHHDLEALHPTERRKFKNKLNALYERGSWRLDEDKPPVLYLCGHTHEARPKLDNGIQTFFCGTQMNSDPKLGKPDMDVLVGVTEPESKQNYVQAYSWEYRVDAWLPDHIFSYQPAQEYALDGKWYFPKRPPEESPPEALKRKYLETVVQRCGLVEMVGVSRWRESPWRKLSELFVKLSFWVSTLKKALEKLNRNGGSDFKAKHADMKDLLRANPETKHIRAFVHSAPGSGKSMLLKWIASVCAAPGDNGLFLSEAGWPDGLLPVWIRCADINVDEKNGIERVLRDSLPANAEGMYAAIESDIKAGRALLLLDGVDEVGSAEKQRRLLRQITRFIRDYPDAHIIAALRTGGLDILQNEKSGGALPYEGDRDIFSESFLYYEIQPLKEEEIKSLCQKWWQVGDGLQPDDELIQIRLHQILKNKRLLELAENPLMLTSLLLVQAKYRKLPISTPTLLSSALDAMLESSRRDADETAQEDDTTLPDAQKATFQITPEEIIPQLAHIAYGMSIRQEPWITEAELSRILRKMWKTRPELFPPDWKEETLELFQKYMTKDSVILETQDSQRLTVTGGVRLSFRYKPFQEYLSALAAVEFYYPDCGKRDLPGDALWKCLNASGISDDLSEIALLSAKMSIPCGQKLIDSMVSKTNLEKLKNVRVRRLLLRFLAEDVQISVDRTPRILNACFGNRLMSEDIESMRQVMRGRYRKALRARMREMGKKEHGDPEYWMPLLKLLQGYREPYAAYLAQRENASPPESRKESVSLLAYTFWMYRYDKEKPYDLDLSDAAQKEITTDLLSLAEYEGATGVQRQALQALKFQLNSVNNAELPPEAYSRYLNAIASLMEAEDRFPPVDFLSVLKSVRSLAQSAYPADITPIPAFSNPVEKFLIFYGETVSETDRRMQYLDLLAFALLAAFFRIAPARLREVFRIVERYREIIWEKNPAYRRILMRHLQIAPVFKAIAESPAYAKERGVVKKHLARMDFAIVEHLRLENPEIDSLRTEYAEKLTSYLCGTYPDISSRGNPDWADFYDVLKSQASEQDCAEET